MNKFASYLQNSDAILVHFLLTTGLEVAYITEEETAT